MRAVRSGCEDGVEWVEQEDAIICLRVMGLNAQKEDGGAIG